MSTAPLLADLLELFKKHKIESGMLVIPQKTEFMLVSYDMTRDTLRLLGSMLVKNIPAVSPNMLN